MSPRERRLLLTVFEGAPYEPSAKQVPDLRRLERLGMVITDGELWDLTDAGRAEVSAIRHGAGAHEGGESNLGVLPDGKTGAAHVAGSGGTADAARAGQKESDTPIYVNPDEARVNDEAIQRLAGDLSIYQRAGRLVRITPRAGARISEDETPDSPEIEELPLATLREKLAQCCTFLAKNDEGKWKRCHPPTWCVPAVYSRGFWPGIRQLKAVIEFPVLRRDGSVLQTPGYDPATGLEYRPNCTFSPIPDEPTQEQIDSAKGILRYAVQNFPFAKLEHFSTWLAGVITPFARHAFRGPSPLFLVDANVRGIGKTTLVDIAHVLLTGDIAPRSSQLHEDAAEEKRITSIARSGAPLLLVDNCSKPIGNGVLDNMLTSASWKERLLSTNDTPTYPLVFVTWMTANNAQIKKGADTARRTAWCRLETKLQNPELRKDFAEVDILAWARKHRGELVAAVLTLLRAFFAYAEEPPELEPWASYTDWNRVVRGCLVWHGYEDPQKAQAEFSSKLDPTAKGLDLLVAGWREMCQENSVYAATASEALQWLKEDLDYKYRNAGHRLRYETLVSALRDMTRTEGQQQLPNTHDLGYLLRSYRGRVVDGGWALEHAETQDKGKRAGQLWAAVQVSE
jgi:disulfide oxidoreductase YuzD